MNRTRYLVKNTLIFTLGNFGSKLVSFLLVPLYTNALVKSQYGTVDLITNICMVAAPIVFFNIGEAVMRFALDKGADINKIMSVAYVIMLFALLPGSVFAFGLFFYKRLAEYFILIILYTFSMGVSQIFFFYLRGKELLLKYSIGNILQTLLIAIFNILFLIVFDWGITGYLLAYILSYFITAIYAFISSCAFDVFKHFHFDKVLSKQMIKYAIVLLPNNFMWWIMNSSDRFMVIEMINADEGGIYAVSYKLPSIVAVLTGAFNQAYSYSAIKEDGSKDRVEFSDTVFDAFFSFLLLFGFVLLIFLKPVLYFYVEKEYFTSWKFSPPLVVGMIIMSLGTFLSNYYVVNKDSKGFMLSATMGAIVNIALNFFLIPRTGALGAAIATCLSYFAVFIYRFFDIKKYIKLHVFTMKNIIAFVLLLIASLLVYWESLFSILIQIILLILFVIIKLNSIKSVYFRLFDAIKKKSINARN